MDIERRRHNWSRLSAPQLGKYAEYLVKMEFLLCGCDVYTSEVDDHGIDFVARTSQGNHYDVQVKSLRRSQYVFLPKDKFRIHPTNLLALVLFVEGEPARLFLVHSCVGNGPNPIFKGYDYEGKRSDPEWGITLSKKKLATLDQDCNFHDVLSRLT